MLIGTEVSLLTYSPTEAIVQCETLHNVSVMKKLTNV